MAIQYVNETFYDLLNAGTSPEVKEAFDEWEERGKDKLAPYTVELDGKRVMAYGDLRFTSSRKVIEFETTYGDIIELTGKERPRYLSLNFLIEYDFVNDNTADMQEQVSDLERIKEDGTPVTFSIKELGREHEVTIDDLDITYKGVRDIYVTAGLKEVKKNANNA